MKLHVTAAVTAGVLVATALGVAPATAANECQGETATIVGTHGRDTLRGTGDRDVIAGLGGADRIFGGDGDDVICGNTGADYIQGDDGADQLTGDGGADEIRGNRGVDGIEGGAGRDRLLGGNDDDVIEDHGFGPDWISGQSGYDYVSDRINWGNGHVVKGGTGRDYLYLRSDQSGRDAQRPGRTDLRSGRTVVFERPRIHARILGFEEIALPRAPWTIYGSGAGETVFPAAFLGGTPRFAIDARMRGGNDKIYGTVKNDTFFGGSGYDTVHDYGGVDRCRSIEVQLGHGSPCDR